MSDNVYISRKAWNNYINTLSKIDNRAADEIRAWIYEYGVNENGAVLEDLIRVRDKDGRTFLNVAYDITTKYGNASAAVAAQMYDAVSELEGATVPDAELADTATVGDVAKTVNGVLKTSVNVALMTGALTRLVKKAGCDTMLKNAERDNAQFAWITIGDTCPFCLGIAAEGWKSARSGRHSEHIHSNCDCTYAIRHNKNTEYKSYNPDEIKDRFYDLSDEIEEETGDGIYFGPRDNNFMTKDSQLMMRRYLDNKNRAKIREQQHEAYELRKDADKT